MCGEGPNAVAVDHLTCFTRTATSDTSVGNGIQLPQLCAHSSTTVCDVHQAAPAAKAKGKGKYLPKDVAAVGMLLLTGLLIMYTGAHRLAACLAACIAWLSHMIPGRSFEVLLLFGVGEKAQFPSQTPLARRC